jgi:hypothetical protein
MVLFGLYFASVALIQRDTTALQKHESCAAKTFCGVHLLSHGSSFIFILKNTSTRAAACPAAFSTNLLGKKTDNYYYQIGGSKNN